MEQYWMPKELDFKNLRYCLNNYKANSIYIRLVGSRGGTIKVNENLENKTLNFQKKSGGVSFLIDSKECFHFPLKHYDKGFSLAYERFVQKNGYKSMVILGTGDDPNDQTLPKPTRSFFRNVLDEHLIEIFFDNKIELTFHSWWEYPHWKYWTVDEKQVVHNTTTKYIKQNTTFIINTNNIINRYKEL